MSDDYPTWRPPAGSQAMPEQAGGVQAGDDELVDAQTMRVDSTAAAIDGAAVWERGENLKNGTVVGHRYVIEKHINSGSFGAVYKARDNFIENHAVALKVLHAPSSSKTARKEALRELQLIASVSHPSVVQFKDYGWIGTTLWFAMPWYNGKTLSDQLKNQRGELILPFSRSEARPIFERLAHGLAAMHDVGVFHHDIKPENIFLATVSGFDGGLPVFLDLGIASKRGEKPVGFTADYVAPEAAAAAMGKKTHEIGAAADVYSLALTLRNVLEPETAPRMEGSHFDFLESRAGVPVEPPSSRDLRYLASHFKRWLCLEPQERPTAEEFADELKVLTAPEDRRQARAQLVRRLVPVVLLAGALVAGLAYRLTRTEELLVEKEERLSEKAEELSIKNKEADLLTHKTLQQQKQIATEAARAEESERKAKHLDRQLEKTSELRHQLNMQLDELREVHVDLFSKHETLTVEMKNLRKDYDVLLAENIKAKTDVEALLGERNQLQASALSLQTALKEAQTTVESLRLKIKNLNKQNVELKGRMKKQNADRAVPKPIAEAIDDDPYTAEAIDDDPYTANSEPSSVNPD